MPRLSLSLGVATVCKTTLKGLPSRGHVFFPAALAAGFWPAGHLEGKLALRKREGIYPRVRKYRGSLCQKEAARETEVKASGHHAGKTPRYKKAK